MIVDLRDGVVLLNPLLELSLFPPPVIAVPGFIVSLLPIIPSDSSVRSNDAGEFDVPLLLPPPLPDFFWCFLEAVV
ncbi:unnamed protein product [Onchocerca flexuosa]|uniref:Secreted protein n=1 Tax=Onchocerca flexuosa TaxID=387005 RepID=A0A183HWQ3_9BILA|nr:unnamed protein product [Onchocerca flexuosa]